MSAPRWQRVAESGYSLLLQLYPQRIRERHGEEMRQAFRDRCREVSAGQLSAWRLFGLEMAPDLAGSLAISHFEEPLMPRMRTALVAFVLLACAWLFQDAISKRFLDVYFTASLHYRHWSEQRAIARDEAQVRAIAERLAASPEDSERALAAFLYAINYADHRYMDTSVAGTQDRIPFELPTEDAARASRLLAALTRTTDVEAARLALFSCPMLIGCDRLAKAQALSRLEPDNAYGWSQVLKAHSLAGNEPAVRADLQRFARSRYYDEGSGIGAWAAVQRFAPGDAAAFGALGRQLLGQNAMVWDDDFRHDLTHLCALPWPGAPSSPSWLRNNPDSRPDCRRAAILLADSKDPWTSRWGWTWLDRDRPSAQTAAGVRAAQTRLLQLGIFGGTSEKLHGWRPWTDAEWLAWAQTKSAAH